MTDGAFAGFLLLALPAFALLAMAMDRHHRAVLGADCPAASRVRLRTLAGGLLAGGALIASLAARPGLAWVCFGVAASCAALVVALALTAWSAWGARP